MSIYISLGLANDQVQQIGALLALALLPFRDVVGEVHELFKLQAIAFVGSFTTLLETMHHRAPEMLNQYSLAPLQNTFVDTSAYSNPGANPATTAYDFHAIRVLAEQASHALGNGHLLPFHPRKNVNGIKFSAWSRPLLLLWGKNDKMMPEGQRHRAEQIANAVQLAHREAGHSSDFRVTSEVFEDAGHFMTSDQPDRAAGAILRFIGKELGPQYLHKAFFGFDEIARKDEEHVIRMFTRYYRSRSTGQIRCALKSCQEPTNKEFDYQGQAYPACCEDHVGKIMKQVAK